MSSSLSRELSLPSSAALVISNMIGAGIFTTTGFLAGDLGRPLLVLAIWIAGAAIALAGCVCYAELGVNLPCSGAEYAYLREAWGGSWGFLSGWSSFFAGFSAPIAAGVLAFSEYLGQIFPSLSTTSSLPRFHYLHAGRAQLLSLGVIAGLAAINILGLRLAARLQNLLTVFKLIVLGAFLVLAFTVGHGSWQHFGMATARSSPHAVATQFAVSLIFVMFAYSGWNAAAYMTEEMKEPRHTLPRALALGTALVALIYLALNVAFIYALPLGSLRGVVAVGATAAGHLFGSRAGAFFSAIMAVALLSCVSAMSLVGPRVYYAMAQDGCFPQSAAQLHPRWQTPARAIVYQAGAAAIMVLTGTFEALIYYIGFTLILFGGMAVAGLLRLRHRAGWLRLRAVNWCYPAIPVAFVAASAWMLLWTMAVRPRNSLFGLLTVGGGWVWYRLHLSKRANAAAALRKQRVSSPS